MSKVLKPTCKQIYIAKAAAVINSHETSNRSFKIDSDQNQARIWKYWALAQVSTESKYFEADGNLQHRTYLYDINPLIEEIDCSDRIKA